MALIFSLQRHFKMSSAICLNLDQSKILSCDKGLRDSSRPPVCQDMVRVNSKDLYNKAISYHWSKISLNNSLAGNRMTTQVGLN